VLTLVDVAAPYRGPFQDWASRQGVRVCSLDAEGPEPTLGHAPLLVVLQATSEADVATSRLRRLAKVARGAPVVVLARRLSIDCVVGLLREGVADVIGLPADPRDVVARSLLHAHDAGVPRALEIVGNSNAIRRVRREAAAVARMRSTVLIVAEPGTGKADLAATVHRLSPESHLPFLHVDCEAFGVEPEVELFGSVSPDGGVLPGRLEAAGRGTIYLDGVDSLADRAQGVLLGLLRERSFRRPCGSELVRLEGRIVAASRHDLREAVAEGRFRSELLYRLNTFELRLPPLRERLDDLPMLVRHHLERIARRQRIPTPRVEDSFYEASARYPWPGNVRELVHLLEGLCLSEPEAPFDGERLAERLPLEPECEPSASDEAGDDVVAEVLRATGGNVARAARRLGVPRSTLRYRIQRAGLAALIPGD